MGGGVSSDPEQYPEVRVKCLWPAWVETDGKPDGEPFLEFVSREFGYRLPINEGLEARYLPFMGERMSYHWIRQLEGLVRSFR